MLLLLIVIEGSGPKCIHLFVNKYNVNFEDVENMKPTQEIELTPQHLTEFKPVPLKLSLFQNVTNLTVTHPKMFPFVSLSLYYISSI
jgi:hypothetical protein